MSVSSPHAPDRLLAAALTVFGLASVAHAETRELYPNTPDETIVRRAGGQAKALWAIPVGPALVEDMQRLAPDRLLVLLRKDFPRLPNLDAMLVDTAKGTVVWRFARDTFEGEFDTLLALQDLFLFRVNEKTGASLLSIDPRTGTQKWAVSRAGERVTFIPHPAAGIAIAVNPGSASVELSAIDLDTGKPAWSRVVGATDAARLPLPLPIGEDIFTFFAGLERVSGRDGKVLFHRPEIPFGPDSPPPQIEGTTLWAVASGGRLTAVATATGEPVHTLPPIALRVCTNIFPLGPRVYVRGLSEAGLPAIAAVDPAAGRTLWTHESPDVSVSNLIEYQDLLFGGTPSSIVGVRIADGKPTFSVRVTTTGRTFPVRLRLVGDRIVWIGELMVAGYDAATGRLAFKHGMTPGAEELHLNGLDAAGPSLTHTLGEARGVPGASNEAGRRTSLAFAESMRFQNLSNSYHSQYLGQISRGDSIGASVSSLKAGFARQEAAFQEVMGVSMLITNLAMLYRQMVFARSIETFVERQILFRRSILASYSRAEAAEFVHRPHLAFKDATDEFLALSVVNLRTGKRADTPVSPRYLSYGLWQVVDFDNDVGYHCHVGLDPSRYTLSEARIYYPYTKAKTVNTFLIAQPIKVPR
ncbi:MAG: PQQ-binding-like beta-propeller repeat protein [Acidobacteriota bacterium]